MVSSTHGDWTTGLGMNSTSSQPADAQAKLEMEHGNLQKTHMPFSGGYMMQFPFWHMLVVYRRLLVSPLLLGFIIISHTSRMFFFVSINELPIFNLQQRHHFVWISLVVSPCVAASALQCPARTPSWAQQRRRKNWKSSWRPATDLALQCLSFWEAGRAQETYCCCEEKNKWRPFTNIILRLMMMMMLMQTRYGLTPWPKFT